MVCIDLNYVVHDAKVQLYFYIASDIFKKSAKKSARRPKLDVPAIKEVSPVVSQGAAQIRADHLARGRTYRE